MRWLSFGLLLTISAAAPAAVAAPQPAPKPPCASDVQRFCKDVPIGNGRRIACLNSHKAALTPACRERVPKLQALFEYGLAQRKKVDAYLAKHPEADDEPAAPPQKKPAPPKSGG